YVKSLHTADILLVRERLLIEQLLLGPDVVLSRRQLLLVVSLIVRPFEIDEVLLLSDRFLNGDFAERRLILYRRLVAGERCVRDLLVAAALVERVPLALHGVL